MKNAIVYYYNFVPSDIHQNGKKFTFEIDGVSYIFTPVTRNEQEVRTLYELSLYLYNYGIYCHQIILNKDKQFVTFINGDFYILLRVYINNKRKISINDVDFFNQIMVDDKNKMNKLSWYDLWIKKIDYFEYQVNQLGKRYPLIRESFGYFIGLGENALSIIRDVPQLRNHISHLRISVNDNLSDFYNPLNLVIDSKVRNIAEYYKSCLFEIDIEPNKILYNIINDVENNYFTIDECILFLGRMIYPTYYFDLYEQIISGDVQEKELLTVISKIDDYEYLIKGLYSYFKSIMKMPEIDWLTS